MGKVIQQNNHILSSSCFLQEIFLFLILKNWPKECFMGIRYNLGLLDPLFHTQGIGTKSKFFAQKYFISFSNVHVSFTFMYIIIIILDLYHIDYYSNN
jgi:hypothetical protein